MTLLEQLPARVDALAVQVSQLRDEMRSEFSAVRGDIQTGLAEVMTHARLLHDDQKVALALVAERLRDEIKAGDARVMDQARVLHEDMVGRLALIQEGIRASATHRRKE